MMDLNELLIKLMQLGIMVIGILIIFFMFISFNVNVYNEDTERQAYVLGDYLLSSKCLTEMDNNNVIKSLFSETKLDNIVLDHSCINYENGMVNVSLISCGAHPTCKWNFELKPETTYIGKSATFTVAIEMNDGSIEPATIMVTL
jgi:predicted GTPase